MNAADEMTRRLTEDEQLIALLELRNAIIIQIKRDLWKYSPSSMPRTELAGELRRGELDWLFEGLPMKGAKFLEMLIELKASKKRRRRKNSNTLCDVDRAKLKTLVQADGRSVYQIAKSVSGLAPRSIDRPFKSDTARVTEKTLNRIAAALGCEMKYLLANKTGDKEQ